MFFVQVRGRPGRRTRPWTTAGRRDGHVLAGRGHGDLGHADDLAAGAHRRRDLRPARGRGRADPAGADGLVVLPYFAGERTPIFDPHARGRRRGPDAAPRPRAPLPCRVRGHRATASARSSRYFEEASGPAAGSWRWAGARRAACGPDRHRRHRARAGPPGGDHGRELRRRAARRDRHRRRRRPRPTGRAWRSGSSPTRGRAGSTTSSTPRTSTCTPPRGSRSTASPPSRT